MDELRCIYLPVWGSTLLEHPMYPLALPCTGLIWRTQVHLPASWGVAPYWNITPTSSYYHLSQLVTVLPFLYGSYNAMYLPWITCFTYVYTSEWFGLAHYHNFIWPSFSSNHTVCCVIFLHNLCDWHVQSGIISQVLQRQIILVSRILPVHLLNFLCIKMDLNISGNVDICSWYLCASVCLLFLCGFPSNVGWQTDIDIVTSLILKEEWSTAFTWCKYAIVLIQFIN